MRRLQDRVAVVVGAGSAGTGIGNGRAIAIEFARHGARVVAIDRSAQAAEQTRAMIAAEGGACIAYAADAADASQLGAAIASTVAEYGRIDILVNNVGIVPLGGPIELSEEAWDRAFAANAKSVFLGCKFALPHMLKQGRGAIVNISSMASIRSTTTAYCAYTASKAAMNAFSHSIAVQYAAKGIRSNVVLLGMIDTPLVREQLASTDPAGIESLIASRNRASPTGAMGTVWDAAHAALFLASDESSYVNGAELVVDAGMHKRTGPFPSVEA